MSYRTKVDDGGSRCTRKLSHLNSSSQPTLFACPMSVVSIVIFMPGGILAASFEKTVNELQAAYEGHLSQPLVYGFAN